ncbi:MAG: hypothetical protein DMG73_12785 [Acidobacteria bacterium]|nr:MAG: hypothetical protein DMG73_12785 [Acidobacteriota bacterium]PYX65800.1 MAG: hypothetical protein DMG74_06885 [Acidobacteriota bacterium]
MGLQLGYYFAVRSSILILCLALLFVPILPAQIHGVPPSVTSLGPGRGSAPGVPASVTSLGPNGFEPDNQFFQFPQCCMNPLFPLNPNPPLFRRRHHPVPFFPVAVPVYTMPYYPEIVSAPVDDSMEEEDYRGGPTIFDRRGSGERRFEDRRDEDRRDRDDGRGNDSRYADRRNDDRRNDERISREDSIASAHKANPEAQPAAAMPETDQPDTILVFKDGHKLEVKNYAIQGDMLYDLTPGHPRKIALAELDVPATQKQNDDQGIIFQLPAHPSGN